MNLSFWDRVDTTGECWLWTGALNQYGYGVVEINGRTWLAHRFAFIDLGGQIPEGYELDHLCRVRSCVRHLEPVTRRTNQLRGNSPPGVNSRKTECIHGHPFDEANTHIRRNGTRECRRCNADRAARNAAKSRTQPKRTERDSHEHH